MRINKVKSEVMATVNLLKASFNGKLGEVYGTKQYGNAYAKAIPFSHAPHSNTQTKCVRAFEKLNRLASGISAVSFPFLGLSDKKMLRHNAVAQWLKPLIESKRFQPSKLAEIIDTGDGTEIVSLDVNLETNTLSVNAKTTKEVSVKDKKRWFVVVFDDNGEVLISSAPTIDFFTKTVTTPLSVNRMYYALAFRSEFSRNKFFLGDLSLTIPMIVKNGILYTSNTEESENFEVVDGILKYTGSVYKIKNNLLVIE